MAGFFLARDYPREIIERARTRVDRITREQAMGPKEDSEGNNRIILTLTYNAYSKPVKDIVENNFQILKLDQEVGYLFQEKPLVSYRRDKNIKDMLVKSQFLTSQNTTGVTMPCGRKRCVTCDFVFNEEHTVHGPKGSFSPQGRFSCVTKDVIYCIECGKCGDIYIGETEKRLGDRIREHLRDVKTKNRNKEVAIHFNSPGHSLENFKVQILYENKDNLARKIKESYFIMKFGCIYSLGMNRDSGIVL